MATKKAGGSVYFVTTESPLKKNQKVIVTEVKGIRLFVQPKKHSSKGD